MEEQRVETTTYSLSEAPPSVPGNRREGERHLTLFRVGSITIDDRRELCLIKNISGGGMMIRAYGPISLRQKIIVELKSGQPISGRVSWVREPNVGISFDQQIDVIEILSASMDGPRPRMPRIEVACHATVREGATSYRMRACDISQGGIKLEAVTILPTGADVVVSLAGLPAQRGLICWADDGFCGVTFNQLVPLPLLIGWLQTQRGNIRAA